MRLPDFICVGPGRTGTTWLHAALTGHVGLPLRVKETRFWGQYYHKGIDWYAEHFRHCNAALPVGEACPYFSRTEARERIAQHLPDCKIIVTLRDPVDRSYSQYRLLRNLGFATGSFEEEIQHPRIAETNRYAHHLRGWMDLFGTEKLRVLLFDELRRHPQRFLDQVCQFIGIAPIDLATQKIRESDINSYRHLPRTRRISRRIGRLMDLMHEKRAYRLLNLLDRVGFWGIWLRGSQTFAPLPRGTELRLREQFIPEIEAVEALTGLDLSAWRQPSEHINQWLETAPKKESTFGRREIAAIALALIPLATGAVPDGLDLGTMRFNPVTVTSMLEAGGEDGDEAMILALV